MNDLAEKRERYLRDALPVRLGGLAANLARVNSFAKNSANGEAVKSLIQESKFFIEWTAAETEIEIAARLAEFQVQMAVWQTKWNVSWNDEQERLLIGQTAKIWSQQVLLDSGLLN